MPKTQTETYETAARKARVVRTLDVVESRFAFADASGSLAKRLRDVVQHNRQKAANK